MNQNLVVVVVVVVVVCLSLARHYIEEELVRRGYGKELMVRVGGPVVF